MACGPEAGNQLVFVSAVDGDPEIMVVDTQSGEASPITHNNALDLEPRWSPGGKKIVYVSDQARSFLSKYSETTNALNFRKSC